jgi:hypothetical protein
MQITKVCFKKLVSGDNYSNTEIGAWADVDKDTPEDAFVNVASWVQNQFRKVGVITDEMRDVDQAIFSKRHDLQQLEREINTATEKINAMRDFLKKHGVEIEHELPF